VPDSESLLPASKLRQSLNCRDGAFGRELAARGAAGNGDAENDENECDDGRPPNPAMCAAAAVVLAVPAACCKSCCCCCCCCRANLAATPPRPPPRLTESPSCDFPDVTEPVKDPVRARLPGRLPAREPGCDPAWLPDWLPEFELLKEPERDRVVLNAL